jgi:exosortase O
MGFAGACAAAALLLRSRPQTASAPGSDPPPEAQLKTSNALAFSAGLLGVLLLMSLLYSQRPPTGLVQAAPAWSFPRDLFVEPLALKPDEIAWLTRDGAESASRYRFDWHGLAGSMILVPSSTWRAHHRPERCFEVFGLTLDNSRAELISPDFSIRAVTLRDPASGVRLEAAYWFQSASQTTDDYGTRIWGDTVAPAQRWVLVSLLFDGNLDRADDRVSALYHALQQSIARELVMVP